MAMRIGTAHGGNFSVLHANRPIDKVEGLAKRAFLVAKKKLIPEMGNAAVERLDCLSMIRDPRNFRWRRFSVESGPRHVRSKFRERRLVEGAINRMIDGDEASRQNPTLKEELGVHARFKERKILE